MNAHDEALIEEMEEHAKGPTSYMDCYFTALALRDKTQSKEAWDILERMASRYYHLDEGEWI